MREQRKRAGLIAYIAQNQIHQPWLELPMTAPGRFLNGASQLFACHWTDVFLFLCYRVAQFGILREVCIKISAQCQDERDVALHLHLLSLKKKGIRSDGCK